jgi:hypothetical protein
MPVVTQVQVRRGTAAQWTSANPTLASGEQGFETDTLKLKIGNGSTAWNSLAYVATGATGTVTSVAAGTGLTGGTITGTGTIALSTPVSVANGGTGISSFGANVATWLGTPSSANLAAALTDETGTGLNVFATSPTLTTPTLNDPKINLTFDPETASYTAVLANNGQVVTMDNASANTFSIPTNASVAFPIGTQINVLQIGAGQTTIQAVTSGTTGVLSTGATAAAPKIRARYGMATCIKSAADTWYVVGDIV